MLVEVRAKGLSTFMLAKVPNKDVEDVRAMYLEKTLTPKDYKDLWERSPPTSNRWTPPTSYAQSGKAI